MCGRYQFSTDLEIEEIEKIVAEIERTWKGSGRGTPVYKTGEIFPTDLVPVIALGREKNTSAGLMRWGLPRWDSKGAVINARSETAAEKKMFAEALKRRRCVIPSSGFYEWQKKDPHKPKEKFLFTSSKPVLYMAGLFNIYPVNGENSEKQGHFAILTREADDSISDIHDRMPVILEEAQIQHWLTDPAFIPLAFSENKVELSRRQVIAGNAKEDSVQTSLF